MLIAWLGDNNTSDWPVGLKFVQFQKNTRHHSGIQQTPYEALFGISQRVGLRSTALPSEVLERIITEDDLFSAVSHTEQRMDDASQSSTHPQATSDLQSDNTSQSSISAEASNKQTEKDNSIGKNRKRAREAMLRQAEKMVKRSRVIHAPGELGDNVTVPIPLVDRGRGDPRNLMGVIVDRDDNGMYRIAVASGILAGKYSRNQFDLCAQRLLTMDNVSQDTEVSLRTAVQLESRCGGQGFQKCNCAGTGNKKCQTNKCKCFKAKLKCNSRCHSSLTCCNK